MKRRAILDILAPTMGLDYRIPDTMKTLRHASDIKNMRLQNGEFRKDWGTQTYGTNQPLQGTPCKIDVYKEQDGDLRPLAFTTTNIYELNTGDQTWNVIGRNDLIDDCEDAWDAQANVTATADSTVYKRGTKSAKLVIDAAFGTGLAASEDISSTNVTTYSHLHLWVRSDISVSADDLRLRLSEETTGGTGATYADYSIPALTAATWTEVEIDLTSPAADDGGTYPDDLNALLSVALVVQTDNGAQTVYLDDIRVTDQYIGTQDDGWNGTEHNNEYFAVNSDDPIQRKQQAGSFDDMAGADDYKAKDVHSFAERLMLLNTTESGSPNPSRVRWTIAGPLSYASSDWTGTGSGYVDLTDTAGLILKGAFIGNELIVYKNDSIFAVTYIGGDSVFRKELRVSGLGLLSQRALIVYRGRHYFLGTDYKLYEYTGLQEPVEVPGLSDRISTTINPDSEGRCIMILDQDYNEMLIGIPTGTNTQPDTFYRYNFTERNWSKSNRTFNCVGTHQEYSAETYSTYGGTYGSAPTTYGDASGKTSVKVILVADSSGYIYKISRTTVDVNGEAQESYFDTIDITFHNLTDNEQRKPVHYINTLVNVRKFMLEAYGSSATIYYSEDGGRSWNVIPDSSTHTLDNEYDLYQNDISIAVRKIRFRIYNNNSLSDVRCRYLAIEYQVAAEEVENG